MIVYNRIKETKQKQKGMHPIKLSFQVNQLILVLAVVASSMLVIFLINSIDLTSQQQYVFAREYHPIIIQ